MTKPITSKTSTGSQGAPGNNAATTNNAVANPELIQNIKDAYIYCLPLVIMDVSRRQMTSMEDNPMGAAINTFRHLHSFPDANFKNVVRPNADTFYSTAWLDLTGGPMVLSVPNTNGRYYMMPMLDAYSNVFASPGTRTTGNDAGDFLITGPGWSGNVPEGMKEIKAPTNMVWIIGRTQVNSEEDGEKVVTPLQEQYKLTPLNAWGKEYTAPDAKADPTAPKGDPNFIVKNMPVDEFFNYADLLLGEFMPHAADAEATDRFATQGIGAGLNFDMSTLNIADRNAVNNIPKEVFADLDKQIAGWKTLENGWLIHRSGMGTYGTNYAQRALVAYMGLGANLPEDAIYPSCSVDADGKQLNGMNRYLLHFDKDKTPPSKAFWSLTMYGPDGYMVDNPISRNSIGDRSNLKFNEDGSVDIYIQNAAPGGDKDANWLPAPTGDFNILMRVYWPKDEMIDGSWQVPAIKKI